jgi:hypothetical protein
MKKIVTIVAVALFGVLVLPSCKKDYTCTCTFGGQSASTTLKNVTKKDAKAACESGNIGGASCSLD